MTLNERGDEYTLLNQWYAVQSIRKQIVKYSYYRSAANYLVISSCFLPDKWVFVFVISSLSSSNFLALKFTIVPTFKIQYSLNNLA